MRRKFEYHGHTLEYQWFMEYAKVTCQTCSIPLTISEAVKFMVNHNVQSLVVDGQEIRSL